MKRPITLVAFALGCLAFLGTTLSTSAVSYTGDLTFSGGGITVSPNPGNWANTSTMFSWTVTDTGDGLTAGWWRYTYTWTAEKPDQTSGGEGLSHLIIELSPNVTLEDDFVNLEGTLGTYEDDNGSDNPGLPSAIFGIKVDGGGSTNFTLEFDSSRAPVWGDFYAKDGNQPGSGGGPIYAYNEGFPDPDPTDAPADGSINNHILRPDTTTSVPDGGATLMLLGMALAGIKLVQRKFS